MDTPEKLNQETGFKIQESEIRKTEKQEVMQDVQERAKVPEHIKTWLERVEADPTQMPTVQDDNGQPLLQSTNSANPTIKLPVTRKVFLDGFKKKVDDAGKWLSAFILRVIKIKDGKVKFSEE